MNFVTLLLQPSARFELGSALALIDTLSMLAFNRYLAHTGI
jgi:hypothetical protein